MTTIAVGDLMDVRGMKYSGLGFVANIFTEGSKSLRKGKAVPTTKRPKNGPFPVVAIIPCDGQTDIDTDTCLYYNFTDLQAGRLTLHRSYDRLNNDQADNIDSFLAQDYTNESFNIETARKKSLELPEFTRLTDNAPSWDKSQLSEPAPEMPNYASLPMAGPTLEVRANRIFNQLSHINAELYEMLLDPGSETDESTRSHIRDAQDEVLEAQHSLVAYTEDERAKQQQRIKELLETRNSMNDFLSRMESPTIPSDNEPRPGSFDGINAEPPAETEPARDPVTGLIRGGTTAGLFPGVNPDK